MKTRQCPSCGKRFGSNVNRCIRCWDRWADITLGRFLRKWQGSDEFPAVAQFFLVRNGPLLKPAGSTEAATIAKKPKWFAER